MATTQLDTFSTAGVFTYTIPSWAYKIDIVALGGGGGGQAGGAGFNNGGGGGAGTYSSQTLVRGIDIGFSKTSLTGYVGPGGTGGPNSTTQPTAGSASALAVEFGAVGTGLAIASGTGTISGSWTHTPDNYDDYVVVAVGVVGAGIGNASATRSVTYDGTAMTSLGVRNSNNTNGNGWVEMFGLAITSGAGAKTVAVTVTSGVVAFTNLRANSVSYGNVASATLGGSNYGSTTSPSATAFTTTPGGMLVGAIFATSSTGTAYATGVTGRYSDNAAAPSFFVTESSTLDASYPYLSGGTLSASSAWAVLAVSLNPSQGNGGGGGANAGTTEQGSSPGNLTFNGQTYTGGGTAGTNNNGSTIAGNAPGGGGAGTNGVFLGTGPAGGAGGTGRVWIFAYAQYADVSTTFTTTLTANSVRGHRVGSTTLATTAALTAIGLRQARVGPSLVVTATRITDSLTRIGLPASLTVTATISSVGLRNIPTALTPLSVSATTTSVGLRNALVSGSVSVSVGLSSALTNNNSAQATTSTTATITSAGLRNTFADSSFATTASLSSSLLRDIPSSTTQSETATTTSAGLRNAIVDSSISVVAALSCLILGQARPQSSPLSAFATVTTAGSLSGLLNSALTVSTSITSANQWAALFSAPQSINFSFPTVPLRDIPSQVSLPVAATISAVANASFVSPSVSTLVTDTISSAARLLAAGSATSSISCTLTADSLRLARVDVAQPITATRNSIVRWDAYFASSAAITSTSSPVLKNSTTIDATTLPGFPYYLPMRFGVTIKASFSGFITRLQYADAPRSITVGQSANANGALRFSSSLSVSETTTTVLNSNQPTQSTTLAITSNQSSAALRNVFASASLPVTATISSTNVLAGFFNTTIDVVITDSTSATEILFAVAGQSQTITVSPLATALRNARADTALAVTASRTPNVNWYANFGSIATAVTATQSAYAVYSTTIGATTLPGFPYYFPMRFGTTFTVGTGSTVSNRFTTPTVPTAVVATISAAPRAGWSATPSLAVAFGGSQNGNVAAAIATNTAASASSTPDTRKNIFISAINTAITDTVSGSSLAGFYGSASLATSPVPTAVNNLATVIAAQASISAASSPNSLRDVRVSPSLLVSGTFTTVANYKTTAASSLPVVPSLAASLNGSTSIDATTLPGFPYYLPMRFGTTFRASLPLSMAISYRVAATLYVFSESTPRLNAGWSTSSSLATSFVTSYPGFPYQLPFRLGLLNTKANTSTSFQASQTITSSTSSSDKMSALLDGTLSVSSSRSFSLLRDARVASGTTAVAVTASGDQRLGGFISSSSPTFATINTDSRTNMSLLASLGVTTFSSSTGLRNAIVNSSLAITTAIAGYNTLAGFLDSTLPLIVTDLTSATEILAAVSYSSQEITVTKTADINRRTYSAASLSVAAGLTPILNQKTSCATSLPLASLGTALLKQSTTIDATTLPGFPYYLPMRFGVTMRASTTAAIANTNIASASLGVTANRSQSVAIGTKIAASLAANFVTNYPGFPYTLPFLLGRLNSQANVYNGISSTTPISFLPSASARQNFAASANRQINVSYPADAIDTESMSAHLTVKSSLVPCFPYDLPLILSSAINAQASMSRNQKFAADLQISSTRLAQLGINIRLATSLVVNFVTNYQGTLPYTLPFLLGKLNTSFTLNRSAQSSSSITSQSQTAISLGQSLSATTGITGSIQSSASRGSIIITQLTVKNAIVPCFPYYLPILLSSAPNARASALRNARVNASLAIDVQRPTNIGILVKGSVSLAVSVITNYQCLPYALPYLLGHLDTRASLSRSIQTSLSGQAAGTSNSSQNQKLNADRQITALPTTSGSRDALVSASLKVKATTVPCFPYVLPFELNTVSVQQASATRLTRATSNTLAIGVRGMDPTFMPGFPYMLPFKIGVAAPSPRMSVGTKISSSVLVNTLLSADLIRNVIVFLDEIITVTRQSTLNIKTSAASSLTISTIRPTIAAISTQTSTSLVVAARTYGFPYQLPINLGPVNSVRLSRSISAQTAVNVTTTAFLAEAGATLVSLPVSVSGSASARSKAYISVNSRPGFTFTLPLLLQGGSFDITASRAAVLGFVRTASTQTNATASIGNPSTLANYSANPALPITARPTANANFVAAISSSLANTVIINALAKYRINLAAPLTVSPISFVRMNFRTTMSAPLDVQGGPSANATFDTVLSAPLPVSAIADTVLSQASKNSASLSVSATRNVSGLRDTKASAATINVSATTDASMYLAAVATGPLPITVSTDVRPKGYGTAPVSLSVSSNPVAQMLQRSAISAPSNISFITNTIEKQSQRFSTTINSLADLLSVVTKDQKIGSPTSATLAGIFSSILRSVTATAQPVIVASRPTTFKGDFFCGTQMGITAQPSIVFSWAAHADIPLDVTAGLNISASRGQFLVSVGTAVSADVVASAEPYRAAGTFLPYFYAGSNFY